MECFHIAWPPGNADPRGQARVRHVGPTREPDRGREPPSMAVFKSAAEAAKRFPWPYSRTRRSHQSAPGGRARELG
ncbi:hypothetical protein GCM10023195_81030 [Actinoallomurus liliacearum]|uniref:Uncharacterized protein n=1 Tax=Actinoallomurus liliacearum TaxID=1080073 RepID=A0ABP8TZH0_9ACTN